MNTYILAAISVIILIIGILIFALYKNKKPPPQPVQTPVKNEDTATKRVSSLYSLSSVKPYVIQGPPVAKEVTIQQLLGGSPAPKEQYKQFVAQCNNQDKGSYIEQIQVNSGDLIDAIGFKCSDGTIINAIGGQGGKINPPVISYQNKGFNELIIKSGDYIDSLDIQEVDRQNGKPHHFGGVGGSNIHLIQCPANQRLTGLSGKHDQYLMYLEGFCIDIDPSSQ